MSTFKIGDSVKKKSGSSWEGRIVGTYSTELTPEGYAVESFAHKGSVQIYPVNALEAARAALAEQPSVREPLTDARIVELAEACGYDGAVPTVRLAFYGFKLWEFARTVEAAHGIGVKGEA